MSQRRTNDEARTALIDAALAQLHEHLTTPHVEDAIGFLDIHRICADAGYRGTSMTYSLWKNEAEEAGATPKDRFVREVLRSSLGSLISEDLKTLNVALDTAEEQTEWFDFVRVAANEYLSGVYRQDLQSTFRWALTLAADPHVKADIEDIAGRDDDDLGDAYSAVMEGMGRAWRSGVTGADFTLLVRSMMSGMLDEMTVDRATDTTDRRFHDTDEWSVFAMGAAALVEGLTDPVTS